MASRSGKSSYAVAAARLSIGQEMRQRQAADTDGSFWVWHTEQRNNPPQIIANDPIDELWFRLNAAKNMGARILEIRDYYGLTQIEFSALLNVKQASVSRWEKNLAEPSEDNLQLLADLGNVTPAFVRYGPQEPTSTGEFISEIRVRVVGEIDPLGDIDFYKKRSLPKTVARPRECRPHTDVVALQLGDNVKFGIFQHSDWYFFYRETTRFFPLEHQFQLSVIKVVDRPSPVLGTIVGDEFVGSNASFTLLLPTGAAYSGNKVEWASPVISIRQAVYPVDDD
jgi:transcriptional regulator with XRE-family HTH domain